MDFIIVLIFLGVVIYSIVRRLTGWTLKEMIANLDRAISKKSGARVKYTDSGSGTFSEEKQHNSSFKINTSMWKKRILYGAGIVVVIILLLNMIVVIPAGTTGVEHLFGKVRDKELSSGFHLINPLASVEKMTIRTEQYTMSIASEEGQKKGDDSISSLTKEGLDVNIDFTALYRLEEERASDVYQEVGLDYVNKIIRPEIRGVIRDVVSQYEAKDLYSEKRQEASMRMDSLLKERLGKRGIVIEQAVIRNVQLPASLAKAIQEKLASEQESQRYDFVLQKEQKEAERKRIEAEGQRDAQRIIDESLSAEYLNYLYIRELKDRQGTIYVPVDPSSGLPLFKGVE